MHWQKLYENIPPKWQDAAVSAMGYKKNRTRFGSAYVAHRRWLYDFDRAPYEAKIAIQELHLRRFVRSAHSQSQFYAERIPASIVERFRGSVDLDALPTLTKDDLRMQFDKICTVSARDGVESRTGGSTGTPLVVRYTRTDNEVRMALIDHFKARVGFENRIHRRASFTAQFAVPRNNRAGRYSRYNKATNQLLISAYHLNAENLPSVVRELDDFKPHSIDGYFSAILDVAAFTTTSGTNPKYAPIGIFPTSEAVTVDGRTLIQRAFGAKLFDQYASSEGSPFITECVMGTRHIEHSSGIFEVEEDTGDLLVTSFFTSGTPLIRYRIGDRIAVAKAYECPCGITSDVATAIEGKGQDYVLLADGTKIYQSHFIAFTKVLPREVVRVQIVQNKIGHVVLNFQVPGGFEEGRLRSSLEELRRLCGEEMTFEVRLVDSVERLPSGKIRLIVNSLSRASNG